MNDLRYEAAYWGDCTNTFDEEMKHFVYAKNMGIEQKHYSLDARHKRILDIGGGPVSMLLKTINLKAGKVVDPILYPAWIYGRYDIKNIQTDCLGGEDIDETGWDECWIYNCLQHVVDPGRIIANARRAAPVIRLFEWIDIPPHTGHPHMLTEAALTAWLGRSGEVGYFNTQGCFGRAFYGVFGDLSRL
jgi:hypothetical protein